MLIKTLNFVFLLTFDLDLALNGGMVCSLHVQLDSSTCRNCWKSQQDSHLLPRR